MPEGMIFYKGISKQNANNDYSIVSDTLLQHSGFFAGLEEATMYTGKNGVLFVSRNTQDLNLVDMGNVHNINAIKHFIHNINAQEVLQDKKYTYLFQKSVRIKTIDVSTLQALDFYDAIRILGSRKHDSKQTHDFTVCLLTNKQWKEGDVDSFLCAVKDITIKRVLYLLEFQYHVHNSNIKELKKRNISEILKIYFNLYLKWKLEKELQIKKKYD